MKLYSFENSDGERFLINVEDISWMKIKDSHYFTIAFSSGDKISRVPRKCYAAIKKIMEDIQNA